MKYVTWVVVAAAIGLLAIPAVRHLREQPPPPTPAVRLAFAAPPGAELGSGDDGLDAAIAPDEREIVFVATTEGVARLWRRAVASGDAQPLPGTEGARHPAWKQSGGVVSFFAGGQLKQIVLADGVVSTLAAAPAPAGAAWMPDGSLLFAPDARGPIRRMLAGKTSDATILAAGDQGHLFPAATGGDFVYVAALDNGRRVARLATSDGSRDLADTTGHARIAAGYLLRAQGSVLVAQRFDPETRTPTGRAMAVAPQVGVSLSGQAMYTASERLLVFSEDARRLRDLLWKDPATGVTARMSDPGDHWQIRISPDDRAAAVTTMDPLIRTLDVLVIPAGGTGDAQALTRSLAADTDPVWSPDGRRVLFRSLQKGAPRLFARAVGVRGAPDEPVAGSEAGDVATDWIPGRILLQVDHAATGADIWELDLETGARRPVARDVFDERDGRYSPDARWIAYVSDESGQPDVYVRAAAAEGRRVRVSSAGGERPRWSRDGLSLFFVRGSRILRADRADRTADRFAAPQDVMVAPGLRDFDAGHQTDRLALVVEAPGNKTPSAVAIVDWPSLLTTPQ